jgi:hypothetical protein
MYLKTCAGCGAAFETSSFRKTRCKKNCKRETINRAREIKTERHEVEFIGVDGEGINVWYDVEDYDEDGNQFIRRERTHDYVLLSVGDKSLHKNGDYLTHDDIFAFLWEQFLEHPKAAFVGFFLGYDFTNWFKSIPEHAARSLFTKEGIAKRQPQEESTRFEPWPVRDGYWTFEDGHRVLRGARWEFDILAGKRVRLRPYIPYDQVPTHIVTHKDGTQEEKKVPRPWMYICDAGPFFQCSFLTAIHPKDWAVPIVTQDEYDLIERGKSHRSDARFDDDMIRYNLLENEVMARLMTRINEGFVADGIKLGKKQWFGPGQAAQTWMKLIGVPTGEETREVVPQWARDAARKTYYGGWFEIFNHGPVPGTSYAYDINSAYPTIIAELPCLLHGEWTQGTGQPPRMNPYHYRMVYATVRGRDDWVGAMPHRMPDGSILRPRETKGWYWWTEVQASKRAGLISKIQIHEWVNYAPCKCDPPMASIRELYEGRLRAGKNSAQGKGKKLVYNSSYGKLAQSVGNPKFSNPVWASLITSGCRTMILDAIATHPTKTRSLLMVATDGIVFKEPHPSLPLSKTELGKWDDDTYENLSLFMPGLYWDDKSRAMIEAGSTPKLKSRGVSARDMGKVIARVDNAWRKVDADNPVPVIPLEVEWGMITAKQAITRGKWYLAGEIVYGAERTLSGKVDAKRRPDLCSDWGGLRSLPYDDAGEFFETTYYDRGFGEELEYDRDDVDELVTPDGRIGELRAWAFRR